MRALAMLLVVSLGFVATRPLLGAEPFDSALSRAVQAKEAAMDEGGEPRWIRAYELFLLADRLGRSAETQYELGVIASHLDWVDRAAEYYTEALELGLTEPARGKSQSFLLNHRASLASLLVQGKSGTQLRLRGVWRGSLPLARPVLVTPGEVPLELLDEQGVRVQFYALELKPGDQRVLTATLPAPDPGLSSRRELTTSRPRPRQATRGESFSQTTAWGLLASGAGLAVSSTVAFGVTHFKLLSQREQLRLVCNVRSATSADGCEHTVPGKYEAGLELSESVARWRTARAVSLVGLGAGAIAATTGWVLFERSSNPRVRAQPWLPAVDGSAHHLTLVLARKF